MKAFAGAVLLLHWTIAQNLAPACPHENDPNVGPSFEIPEGSPVYRDIRANQTHRWLYRNENNLTVMNQPDQYRKLIINLEPCHGVAYLLVRKTSRCFPNPYSCIDITPGQEKREGSTCQWTHFLSEIDGSRDGSPTFFEVPLSATKYFISVYAPENSAYTLTVLSDIGAFPRPGANGRLTARQLTEMQVQISWDAAAYIPTGLEFALRLRSALGISETKQYWIYSAMLLDADNRTNMAVFLRPDKIMNTVCGLQNNTDRQYTIIPAAQCSNGKCNATIEGVITNKRYVFNVVAESYRGNKMAYAGLIMRTDWEVIRQAASDRTLKVVGAVSGSVLGMVILIYFVMLKLYG